MALMINDAARDLHHAARMLHRTRGFTVMALAVLAISIGANVAVFSVVNALLPETSARTRIPNRIVQVVTSRQTTRTLSTSIPKFNAWRFETHAFESIAAYPAAIRASA